MQHPKTLNFLQLSVLVHWRKKKSCFKKSTQMHKNCQLQQQSTPFIMCWAILISKRTKMNIGMNFKINVGFVTFLLNQNCNFYIPLSVPLVCRLIVRLTDDVNFSSNGNATKANLWNSILVGSSWIWIMDLLVEPFCFKPPLVTILKRKKIS